MADTDNEYEDINHEDINQSSEPVQSVYSKLESSHEGSLFSDYISSEQWSVISDDDDNVIEQEEEWDCEESRSINSLCCRIILAMIAITLVAAFFYMIEKRKRKQPPSKHLSRFPERNGSVIDVDHYLLISPIRMAGIDADEHGLSQSYIIVNFECVKGRWDYEHVELIIDYTEMAKMTSSAIRAVLKEELRQKLTIDTSIDDTCTIDGVNNGALPSDQGSVQIATATTQRGPFPVTDLTDPRYSVEDYPVPVTKLDKKTTHVHWKGKQENAGEEHEGTGLLANGCGSVSLESLPEHTTAPELETVEVSDVEVDMEDEEGDGSEEDSRGVNNENVHPSALGNGHGRHPVFENGHGYPPVFTTNVRRRPCDCGNEIRTNGTCSRSTSNSDRISRIEDIRSSVLEVIGARSMDEALIKMETLDAVTGVMKMAGLESSNLIFGIDYTASNKYQGEISFEGQCLHKIIEGQLNPYQQVITIMGQTMAPLAKSGYIPAYGFGDIRTTDSSIFPLKENGHCRSFAELLGVYNDITPSIVLSGPTNFAPLIYQAIEICKEFRSYHILVIVADGQVTNERATRRAILDACKYPLSIIVVGVGDGPWDMMTVFDDNLPKRPWDNFHFVEFYRVTSGAKQPDLAFAMQSLLEIPDQYKQIKTLGLLG